VTGAGLAPVIPLQPYQRNRFLLATEPVIPEPAALYHATVLAFLLHTPGGPAPMCTRCKRKWPCEYLRLAYRLREGF
jgi:hypothetical protein